MASNLQSVYPADAAFALQPFSLDFSSAPLTEEQFAELCRKHHDLKFELTAEGELIIVPPTSPEMG